MHHLSLAMCRSRCCAAGASLLSCGSRQSPQGQRGTRPLRPVPSLHSAGARRVCYGDLLRVHRSPRWVWDPLDPDFNSTQNLWADAIGIAG
ncbi:hypothetical protein EYF80_011548 [Liparis tanakae]|uniref:Uncharacterized protein n=1 Tax=Liparis tanakae TaxID=230148 RepID=A0A4Z2IKN1_9TELE|nr:hypothetical protein EYF80_011548 [Liparis tanakae]